MEPGDRPRTRLVVLFGGRSAEHDVSCVTAGHVLRAADPTRYDLEPVGITREGTWVRADDARAALAATARSLPAAVVAEGPDLDPLPALRADPTAGPVVVLPLLHGPMGEDGTVQGLLELADVPYVGSGVLASAVAMDKGIAKRLAAEAGLAQAAHLVVAVDRADDALLDRAVAELGLPIFVKPANMGSSIGVSRAATRVDLDGAVSLAAAYDEWLVLEEAIEGREIEVAILGNAEPRASVPGEVRSASDFYDYEDKYVDGRAELLIPAPLTDEQTSEVRALAVRAYTALRCEGMARVDFFLEPERGFLLNEVNTIPGFTPISMFPKLWEASGLGYGELIDQLVDLAIERHERKRRTVTRRPSLHRPASQEG